MKIFSYTIFNFYIFPFLGGLYCQECGPPLWARRRNGTLAGLVSAVSWKLHCEGIQNIYKCQIVQINLQPLSNPINYSHKMGREGQLFVCHTIFINCNYVEFDREGSVGSMHAGIE